MHPACVFKAYAGCFYAFLKLPVGGLGFSECAAKSAQCRGVWRMHGYTLYKHTQTLNFDLNFRVLGGFCGSIGGKQGVLPGGDCDSKMVDGAHKNPCFSD